MSWQATTAVRQNTKFIEDKHFAGFRILLAIADHANTEGVCGIAGQPDNCLSVRALAKEARLHRNSILNWLPVLEESGEITVDRYGKGRGSHMVYTINIMNDVPLNKVMAQEEPESPKLMAQVIDVPLIERMAQQVDMILRLMAQQNGTNGTIPPLVEGPVPIEPNQNPPTPLSDFFTQQTGCFANAGTFVEDWELVLQEWEMRYGDDVQDMIKRAVKFARGDNPQGRRYTISSPRSLANIMANLDTSNGGGNKVVIGAR